MCEVVEVTREVTREVAGWASRVLAKGVPPLRTFDSVALDKARRLRVEKVIKVRFRGTRKPALRMSALPGIERAAARPLQSAACRLHFLRARKPGDVGCFRKFTRRFAARSVPAGSRNERASRPFHPGRELEHRASFLQAGWPQALQPGRLCPASVR